MSTPTTGVPQTFYEGILFATLPSIREAVIAEASAGDGAAPDEAAFPGYGGEFLLSMIPEYWTR